ncbi:uncharacterized protein [Anabrus simplex]|uniref:uncharacterized protein n=1 Tax=Anabrus simplex TaxID=316456 RepID=UPI0035A3C5E1
MGRQVQLFFLLVISSTLTWTFCAEPIHRLDKRYSVVDDAMDIIDIFHFKNSANKIVDWILKITRAIIKRTGHNVVDIPDIDEEFRKEVGFLNVKGEFKAEKGWFRDLSSIYRTNDAILSHYGHNFTVFVGLGLGTLELGFDHYRATFGKLSTSGKIYAKAKANSVLLKLNVMVLEKRKCNLTLQDLKVDKLEDVKVHVEGKHKTLNWIMSRIATSVTKHMKKKISHQIEEHLSDAAEKALEKYHC